MALLPPGGNSRKNAVLKRAPHCQRLAIRTEIQAVWELSFLFLFFKACLFSSPKPRVLKYKGEYIEIESPLDSKLLTNTKLLISDWMVRASLGSPAGGPKEGIKPLFLRTGSWLGGGGGEGTWVAQELVERESMGEQVNPSRRKQV